MNTKGITIALIYCVIVASYAAIQAYLNLKNKAKGGGESQITDNTVYGPSGDEVVELKKR